ncbi:alpha-1,2-fucosyltransferase [Gillisia limnaea]|uniref:Glycosyl transferase family 11 n=1 Tax=Gillisia limnaea (strain DSM 15749 / LMG 21470 / R-8282) TaxID=865937 RepID=H2BV81_GILLR|nr:alpha-1,2-fucosyltransferase [Gillisia limnaea]EHQ01746.1 glycosyl transferase family 11 [Gillisia limnaea DSM 15749]
MFISKNTVIIKLVGGLGNQMFQFAIAKIIAEKEKSEVLVDITFYTELTENTKKFPRHFSLGIFNSSFAIASKKEIDYFTKLSNFNKFKKKLGLNYPTIFHESSFNFKAQVLELKAPIYLNGYFQSFRYFLGKEYVIRKIFKFPDEALDKDNDNIKRKIIGKTSVSLHIRRGDYVNNKKTQQFHGNCTIDYYQSAIAYLSSKLTDFNLIFFSDDIHWVRQQFKNISNQKIYVSGNLNHNSWKDMYLMSLCDHNIIANSSFSWWGAWLNKNPEKIIIAPKRWFADTEQDKNSIDLIPSEWYRI